MVEELSQDRTSSIQLGRRHLDLHVLDIRQATVRHCSRVVNGLGLDPVGPQLDHEQAGFPGVGRGVERDHGERWSGLRPYALRAYFFLAGPLRPRVPALRPAFFRSGPALAGALPDPARCFVPRFCHSVRSGTSTMPLWS